MSQVAAELPPAQPDPNAPRPHIAGQLPPTPGSELAIQAAPEGVAAETQRVTSQGAGLGATALGEAAPAGRLTWIGRTLSEIAKDDAVRAGAGGLARGIGNAVILTSYLRSSRSATAARVLAAAGRVPEELLTPNVGSTDRLAERVRAHPHGAAVVRAARGGRQLRRDAAAIRAGGRAAGEIIHRNRQAYQATRRPNAPR